MSIIIFFIWAIAGQTRYCKRSRHRAVRGFRPVFRQGQPPNVGSTTIPIAIAEALAKAIRNNRSLLQKKKQLFF